jgi:DNA adenine methylase
MYSSIYHNMVKPLLKWVGGKTQILEEVLSRFPEEMSEYCEPFVGGGSVLLELLTRVRDGRIRIRIGSDGGGERGRITACDVNPWLVMLYTCVRDDVEEFLRECAVIQGEYDSCEEMNGGRSPTCRGEALMSKESYYYWTRELFNADRLSEDVPSSRTAARLVFLNKMGFRGLYREGPRGYNVPFGNYKNPRMVDEENVQEMSRLFRETGVVFRCCDFRDALSEVGGVGVGGFVYCDPPYIPETVTSFVGYVTGGFDGRDHYDLFHILHGLRGRGVRFLMSNSGVGLVREAFPVSEEFVVDDVEARRAIHSRNPGARTVEVLIRR